MLKFKNYNSTTKVWSSPPLVSICNPKDSLVDILLHGLTVEPDKISEVHDEAGIIFKCEDIRKRSLSVSKKLKSLNLKPGDVVTIACRNFPDLSSLICGCIIAGIVVNLVNPEYNSENFKQIIKKIKPKLIFCNKQNKTVISDALEELCHISNIINVENKMSMQPLFESISNYNDYQSSIISEDTNKIPTLILVTAGSTGPPKCVMLTNAIVISQLLNTIFVEKDDVISVPPFIHHLSGIATTLIGIVSGATRIVSSKVDTETHLKLIDKYKITKILTSTAYLSALADSNSFKTVDLSSIKIIQTTGEALMKTLRELIENQLINGKVVQSYGLVECGGTVTLNYPTHKEYSVGQPTLQNSLKIIDASGNEIGPRQEGEICVKPPYSLPGYYLDETFSKEIVDLDGYIHTGDIGYFDDEDFLFIIGRIQKTDEYTGD